MTKIHLILVLSLILYGVRKPFNLTGNDQCHPDVISDQSTMGYFHLVCVKLMREQTCLPGIFKLLGILREREGTI